MQRLPEDMRAEALLDYLPEGSFVVALRGLHKRNACKDLLDCSSCVAGRQLVELARMSLYNSLPEYLFHPSDRFDPMNKSGMRDAFQEEVARQEKEKEEAIAFFNPIDIALLRLKSHVYQSLQPFATEDKVMLDILTDRLPPAQRQNRFVGRALPLLPQAKWIRGNRTLLTLLIRKIFKEEGLELETTEERRMMEDNAPQYQDCVDGVVGETFAGNRYEAPVTCFKVHYWSDEECDEHFLDFVDEVEQFRLFVKDWVLSVEEDLVFIIEDRQSATWFADTLTHGFLNFNTNL